MSMISSRSRLPGVRTIAAFKRSLLLLSIRSYSVLERIDEPALFDIPHDELCSGAHGGIAISHRDRHTYDAQRRQVVARITDIHHVLERNLVLASDGAHRAAFTDAFM